MVSVAVVSAAGCSVGCSPSGCSPSICSVVSSAFSSFFPPHEENRVTERNAVAANTAKDDLIFFMISKIGFLKMVDIQFNSIIAPNLIFSIYRIN